MNAMPFRSAPTRRASSATQSEIAIGRVLADMGSADQIAHADPALRVACPVCEALSHQRCLERNPKQYVTPHAERAALVTSTADYAANRLVVFSACSPASRNLTAIQEAADRAANRLVVFSAPSPASTNLTAIQDADRAAAFAVRFTPPA
jgi:hypothetical protein